MLSHFTKDAVGQIGGKIQLVPNPARIETINHAIAAYGFLIERNETLTATEFADRIRKAYDCDGCPQTGPLSTHWGASSELHAFCILKSRSRTPQGRERILLARLYLVTEGDTPPCRGSR